VGAEPKSAVDFAGVVIEPVECSQRPGTDSVPAGHGGRSRPLCLGKPASLVCTKFDLCASEVRQSTA
jgi:hypothetical protein